MAIADLDFKAWVAQMESEFPQMFHDETASRVAMDFRLDIARMAFTAGRAAQRKALSHAAGQEAEQRPTNAPETGEWYWLEDGDLFHSQVSMNGQHLGRYYRDDGRGWEDVRKAEKLPPTPPTTSAEVGRDAERYRLLRDRTIKKSVSDGRDDGPFIATGNILRGFSVPRYPDLEIDQALAASSGRQGAFSSNEWEG